MLLILKLFEEKYNEGHERVLYSTSKFLAISKSLTITEAWGILNWCHCSLNGITIAGMFYYRLRELIETEISKMTKSCFWISLC